MFAESAESIQALLARLMGTVRENETLTTELLRAEREFFPIGGKVGEEDRMGHVRFAEWYLLERESEVLGGVPVDCLEIDPIEQDPLLDSLVGIFQVTAREADGYRIEDLQDGRSHDLQFIEGFELLQEDVIIGRLYLGKLDTYNASIALACQRNAGPLAEALKRDLKAMSLSRRMTQGEVEHIMFRGRGARPAEVPMGIPLERLEADLESCLREGQIGEEQLGVTEVSAALKAAERPGQVIGPLLDRIAFDSDADLERVQRLMLQMYSHHHPVEETHAVSPEPPVQEMATEPPTEPPPGLPPESPGPPTRDLDSESRGTLGADIARRIQRGLDDKENITEVFADVNRMVGEDEVEDEEPWDAPSGDGDLHLLVTEFLWESKGSAGDAAVLEAFIQTQREAAVPHLDLESISSSDLLRTLLQSYLESALGQRGQAVARVYAVLESFYRWADETQSMEVLGTLEEVNASLVQETARLEAASLALSQGDEVGVIADRGLLRVVQVDPGCVHVARTETDRLIRVEISEECANNLREDDLLLGSIREETGGGSFTGMVIVMPAAAAGLLG